VLQALGRARLAPRIAVPSLGTGERRSRDAGPGVEFKDYRPYAPGDDVRHLDPRLFARLGEYHLRQYEVQRQLPVLVLIDTSASMGAAGPGRPALARWIAAVLGFVALAGGDRVRIAAGGGAGLALSRRFSGVTSAPRLFEWIAGVAEAGAGDFARALDEAADAVPPGGLAIVVSDFWAAEPVAALAPLAARRAEIWAVHLVDPSEQDPDALGSGIVELADAEGGGDAVVTLDAESRAAWRAAFAARCAGLERGLADLGGRCLRIPVGRDPEEAGLGALRAAGLIA
jgi:uncharacterized protein (DUF58 family)